jgi:hypothetical protein
MTQGGWSRGVFRSVYQRELPVSAMMALAGFDGRRPETYFVARSAVGKLKR